MKLEGVEAKTTAGKKSTYGRLDMESRESSILETGLLTIFIIIFVLFNILTASAFPYPHVDEAMIADPAINFTLGIGFHIHLAEMLVTYCFLLVPWVKMFGWSLQSIRSADVLSMAAAFVVLWLAVKRLELVPRARWRLFLLVVLATEYGMIFSYRSGRYDGFGALLMASALWCMSIAEKSKRLVAIGALCLLVPWAGPQYMPLLFAAGLAALAVFRLRYWQEVITSYVASGIGGALFLGAVAASGRLTGYLRYTRNQQKSFEIIRELLHNGVMVHHNYIPKDFSLPFLLLAVVVLAARSREGDGARPVLAYAMVFTVMLTATLLLISKFPSYYVYMIVIPLSVAICSGLAWCESRIIRRVIVGLFCLSAIAGAGLDTLAWASQRRDHDIARIQQLVDRSVQPGDIVWVDPVAYLAVKRRATDAYYRLPDWDTIKLMSKEQKDSINVVIDETANFPDITRELGGRWRPTGERLDPVDRSIFGDLELGFLNWRLPSLAVYRRY